MGWWPMTAPRIADRGRLAKSRCLYLLPGLHLRKSGLCPKSKWTAWLHAIDQPPPPLLFPGESMINKRQRILAVSILAALATMAGPAAQANDDIKFKGGGFGTLGATRTNLDDT